MNRLFLFTFLTLSLYAIFGFAQTNSSIDTIINRVYIDVAKQNSNLDKKAKINLDAMQEDGRWTDIPYQSTSITKWEPADHLDRITTMLQAYTKKQGLLYGDQNLYNGIVKGLAFWYKVNASSQNWWHNEISVPQKLGVLLIIANYGEKQLPDNLKLQLIERMKKGSPELKTGANKTDIATHYFYRALLTKDLKLLSFAVDQLFEPVKLVDGEEGLQYDFSYLQHGPQLYIAGYGEVYISGVLKMATYVKNTSYALNPKKLALFSTFYRETYLKTIRGNYIDFSVHGRGISRKDILKKSEGNNLSDFKQINPAHNAEWYAAISSFDNENLKFATAKPFHQHFWKADYDLHVRPNYLFTIRTNSTRTKRTETGNKENLYGRYLPDGATNIQVNGPEYFNIMPIWEWDKIPGTTSRDYPNDRLTTVNWGENGYNDFSGGVSDGIYGASAYELKYDSVGAKKAWFLFDDEIVCLGAGITSNTKEGVTTTVNQTWLNGNVKLSDEEIRKDEVINCNANKNAWIYHANVGYYFPDGGQLSLSTQQQEGNWYRINQSFSKENITGDVFKLWINHGVKPNNEKYEYFVLPGLKNEDGVKNFNAKKIQIISNTAEQQTVYHQDLKILQSVFYAPSKVETESFSVAVDKPCIFMLKELDGGKKEIYISDPLFKNAVLKVTYLDKKTGITNSYQVDLPKGAFLGSTKKVEL